MAKDIQLLTELRRSSKVGMMFNKNQKNEDESDEEYLGDSEESEALQEDEVVVEGSEEESEESEKDEGDDQEMAEVVNGTEENVRLSNEGSGSESSEYKGGVPFGSKKKKKKKTNRE